MNLRCIIILAAGLQQYGGNLSDVREACFASMNSHKAMVYFEHLIEQVNEKSTPVAKAAPNPLNKLSFFSRGKKLIELALSKDSNNIECRFLRYSIQKNLPQFLNYDENLVADSEFIEANLKKLKDEDLRKGIAAYLNGEKYFGKIK